jgi:hypothetical protein
MLAMHAVDNNHQVKWEDVSVLAKESNTKEKKIHEAAAIYIENLLFTISHISDTWPMAIQCKQLVGHSGCQRKLSAR